MRLDLDDLSLNELDFVISLLRKCYKCEKEIPITDNDGCLRICGCLYHRNCPSPKIRERHYFENCSLDLKRTIIRGFLNQDLSTAIFQKVKDACPNFLMVLDSTTNSIETLNNKEIVLLIRTFRICFKCGRTASGDNWCRNWCGCILHSSYCPSPQIRTDHPDSCSYEFRAQTVQKYKESINGNFSESFRKHMTDKYPRLIEAIRSKSEELSPQFKLLRQDLNNAKQEILEANNEKELLREELVKANQAVHKTKRKNETLQHELEQANQDLNNAKNEQRMLRLLNEELEKSLETTKKQFECANVRLAVITDEINNLRRQSDAARNELPVEEQREKEFEDEEIVASDKSLLIFEWKKFEEKFVALQEKTELLAHQTITRRSAAVMRANNPKILKASETADEVKNSVIETLRTETNRIVNTEEELFPHSPSQTFSASDSHINDVNLLD